MLTERFLLPNLGFSYVNENLPVIADIMRRLKAVTHVQSSAVGRSAQGYPLTLHRTKIAERQRGIARSVHESLRPALSKAKFLSVMFDETPPHGGEAEVMLADCAFMTPFPDLEFYDITMGMEDCAGDVTGDGLKKCLFNIMKRFSKRVLGLPQGCGSTNHGQNQNPDSSLSQLVPCNQLRRSHAGLQGKNHEPEPS